MAVEVVGRGAELAAIDAFVAAAETGPAALAFEGEPGIGKTTLWEAGRAAARERGARVLASRPGPSETRLTFAGLADLLADVTPELLEQLPVPQRRALDAALLRGEGDGPPPEPRVVATAFLSALRELAACEPVVVAVDDLQWLDAATWHALEFAARRLTSEPVGLLAASRPEGAARARALGGESLRRVLLGGLSLSALHRILAAQLGRSFARPLLVRIERTSSGNPYFALELARAILEQGTEVAGAAPLPLPDDLVQLLRRRVRRLPPSCRDALLAASLLSQPTLALLDVDAIAIAEEAGLVGVDERGRVRFAHPLLAAAVHASAPRAKRRRVHAELALVVGDAEERARHLALAAEAPDERVASALVAAARSARARGAPDSAIELLELAAALTPDELAGERRARRFELAWCVAAAGDPPRASGVLREVIAEAGPGPLRARARVVLALLREWEGAEQAVALCEEGLADAAGDPDLCAEIHAVISRIADFDATLKTAHARAALELLAGRDVAPRLHAYALLALAEAELQSGHGVRRDLLDRAAALEAEGGADGEPGLGEVHAHSGLPLSTRLLAICLLYADELDEARRLFELELRVASDHGDEAQVARTVWRLAYVELKAGRPALAEAYLAELTAIVARTGQEGVGSRGLWTRAQLAALGGDFDSARSAGERALELALAGGAEWLVAESVAALGFVELSAGRLEAARGYLDRADELNRRMRCGDPGILRHHANHVETLVALGERERAEAALEVFERQAETSGGAWGLATATRCRGLVLLARADLDGALASLERALAEHARLPVPFELARTLLVKGRLHRRRNERRLAREALLESAAILEQLGATAWEERARSELQRLGLRKAPSGELSRTEEHVAALAGSGLTNREIAERLFVSRKTVEANLARAYRKLGIRSRAELGALMAERGRAGKT
jgi:DNA-binding CsgD family transcriptional regulator